MTKRQYPSASPAWTIALTGLETLFTIVAVRYCIQQSVWTDEATQLSGLSLHFIDQLRWLTGRLPHLFAVPPDRTPPLSYWLGSLWIHIFGERPLTVRYLSVVLSIGTVFALWSVARQYLAPPTALITTALLALSPNFVVLAAEIRAYAPFILFSTLLIFWYLRLVAARPNPSRWDLWSFSIVATLCSYTHFFGVVISGGAFLCLLAYYIPVDPRSDRPEILRRAVWPLLFYLICLCALTTFIFAAVKNSGDATVSTSYLTQQFSDRLRELVRLIYRLFCHQSMLGIRGISAAALLAGLTLVVFAMMPGSNPRVRPLIAFLFVNFLLISIAGLTTSAFGAFAPTYNAWALPLIALISASTLTHRNRHIRIASTLSISVILTADCYGSMRLATAGELYGHTRSTIVKNAVNSAGLKNVAVLYSNDAPGIYFAMIYDFNGALEQYISRGNVLQLIGPPEDNRWPSICNLNAATLLIAGDRQLSADELQFFISHPDVHTQAYYALDQFVVTHHSELADKWTLVSRKEYLAQSALAVAVFKSRAPEGPQKSEPCKAH